MKKPTVFGKYLLLERLNVGGMAEVFTAKTFGVAGGDPIVAIKRILPTMAEDEEFITMFIDEARISVQLNHANIVHIHELGRHEGAFFIAMEYVPGRDVRAIQERFRRRGERMPTAMAVYLCSKVCEGLDYAHRKRDSRGQELHIIHRDVTPQNLLVGYDGSVRIIDFGIAKAANRSQKTQAGILKGKFGYMSPEQVRGLPIDRRSDIFALGVIIYELLTGEKLFVGESDYSTLEQVRSAVVPELRQFNPNLPPGLEGVVAKALAREADDRYQWASQLHDDLARFLMTPDGVYSGKNLATFMAHAFQEDIAREAQKMARFAAVQRPEGMLTGEVSGVGRAKARPSTPSQAAVTPGRAAETGGPQTPKFPGAAPVAAPGAEAEQLPATAASMNRSAAAPAPGSPELESDSDRAASAGTAMVEIPRLEPAPGAPARDSPAAASATSGAAAGGSPDAGPRSSSPPAAQAPRGAPVRASAPVPPFAGAMRVVPVTVPLPGATGAAPAAPVEPHSLGAGAPVAIGGEAPPDRTVIIASSLGEPAALPPTEARPRDAAGQPVASPRPSAPQDAARPVGAAEVELPKTELRADQVPTGPERSGGRERALERAESQAARAGGAPGPEAAEAADVDAPERATDARLSLSALSGPTEVPSAGRDEARGGRLATDEAEGIRAVGAVDEVAEVDDVDEADEPTEGDNFSPDGKTTIAPIPQPPASAGAAREPHPSTPAAPPVLFRLDEVETTPPLAQSSPSLPASTVTPTPQERPRDSKEPKPSPSSSGQGRRSSASGVRQSDVRQAKASAPPRARQPPGSATPEASESEGAGGSEGEASPAEVKRPRREGEGRSPRTGKGAPGKRAQSRPAPAEAVRKPERRRSTVPIVVGVVAAALLLGGGVIAWLLTGPQTSAVSIPDGQGRLVVSATPALSGFTLAVSPGGGVFDEASLVNLPPGGYTLAVVPKDATLVAVPQIRSVTIAKGKEARVVFAFVPRAAVDAGASAAATSYTAVITSTEADVEVFVDGRLAGRSPSVKVTGLTPGRTYQGLASKKGFQTLNFELTNPEGVPETNLALDMVPEGGKPGKAPGPEAAHDAGRSGSPASEALTAEEKAAQEAKAREAAEAKAAQEAKAREAAEAKARAAVEAKAAREAKARAAAEAKAAKAAEAKAAREAKAKQVAEAKAAREAKAREAAEAKAAREAKAREGRPGGGTRTPGAGERSRAKGKLACGTNIAGAEVWIDGKNTGRRTPVSKSQPIELPVGPHKVVFKLDDGRASPPQEVDIGPGEPRVLKWVF